VGLIENVTIHDQVQDICWNIACPENWVPSYRQNDGIQPWDPRKIVQGIKGMKTTKFKKKVAIKIDCIYI
jgi:hypothetical protein